MHLTKKGKRKKMSNLLRQGVHEVTTKPKKFLSFKNGVLCETENKPQQGTNWLQHKYIVEEVEKIVFYKPYTVIGYIDNFYRFEVDLGGGKFINGYKLVIDAGEFTAFIEVKEAEQNNLRRMLSVIARIEAEGRLKELVQIKGMKLAKNNTMIIISQVLENEDGEEAIMSVQPLIKDVWLDADLKQRIATSIKNKKDEHFEEDEFAKIPKLDASKVTVFDNFNREYPYISQVKNPKKPKELMWDFSRISLELAELFDNTLEKAVKDARKERINESGTIEPNEFYEPVAEEITEEIPEEISNEERKVSFKALKEKSKVKQNADDNYNPRVDEIPPDEDDIVL
jgi:hypothetical protein